MRHHIYGQYRTQPIIEPDPAHTRAVAKPVKTEEWRAQYVQRTAVEQVNSRLKEFHRLNAVRMRRKWKVLVHALLSVITLQAKALATSGLASVRRVA